MSNNVIRKRAVISTATQEPSPPPGVNILPPEKDRIVRPKEAVTITGRSLASQHRDKIAGNWVPAYRIGLNSVGFLLSDLLRLNASREVVTAVNTKPVAPGAKRGRKQNNVMANL